MEQREDRRHMSPSTRRRLGAASVVGVVGAVVSSLLVGSAGPAQAAAVAVPLGSATSFVVLAGAGTTNTGFTRLGGDIGTFPTPAMTGMGDSPAAADRVIFTGDGVNHRGDGVTQGAKADLLTAYGQAKQQATTETVSADLGGQRLTRGVYTSGSTMGLTGPLTLDAEGDPDAVFVFQVGSSLTTATSSSVLLVGEAQACNVFWQVEEDATLGTTSSFVGTLMAENSITLGTGASVLGRMLASNGSVTMDSNTITRSECATPDGENPDEETPDEETPDEETPEEETPDEGTPDQGNPDEDTPETDSPSDDTPSDDRTPPSTPTTVSQPPQVSQVPRGAVDTGSHSNGR
jgi:hypothetical protein